MDRRALLGGIGSLALTLGANAQTARRLLLAGSTGSGLDLNFLGGVMPDGRLSFARASVANYFNSSGVLTSAASGAPRFDYDPVSLAPRGLLIEESRTNSIRNNTMVGAAAGTPGTLPTNWTFADNVGLTNQVVGSGTENGISYLEIRFSGTASGSGVIGVNFEATTAVAASNGQIWAESAYVRLSAGTTTNIASAVLGLDENTSGGAFIRQNVTTVQMPAATYVRATNLATLSGGATTAAIYPWYRLSVTGAGAVDVTLRIGLPQLELGAFATSVISTSSAAVTRAAESCTLPTTGWYNPSASSLVVDASLAPSGNGGAFALLDDATNSNRIVLYSAGGVALSAFASAGGTQIFLNASVATTSANTPFKLGASLSSGLQYYTANGLTPATTVSPLHPTGINTLRLGATLSTTACARIRRVRYWPRALSNTELQQATT